MNYVSVSRGNIPTILLSYLIKDWELLKEETITGGVYDYNQAFKLEQLEFQNAMFLAIYNACSNDMCKIEITKQDVYVYYIDEKADTDLAILDKIISIDGKSIANF